jgi:hypothetical protein
MNALQEVGLEFVEKVFKPTLSARNVKESLDFAKMHKEWTICDWERVILVMRQGSIVFALMGLVDVEFMIKRTF